jgi:hypothetical protein
MTFDGTCERGGGSNEHPRKLRRDPLDKGHAGALYSKSSDPAAEAGMTLFTTTLDLYGGVLCSGELQGFIIHETMPISTGQKRFPEHNGVFRAASGPGPVAEEGAEEAPRSR